MKVREVMTPSAKAIWLTESLADAAHLMWENDCGVLPVIKDGMKVIGMITDRDICMAVAMRDRNPSSVSVEEVISGQVYSVTAEDDIDRALEAMEEHRIRRLPVLNSEGELEGILSLNDVILKAEAAGEANGINYQDVVKTYQTICSHPKAEAASAK
jgi:CBS-domain-containing membrane protein